MVKKFNTFILNFNEILSDFIATVKICKLVDFLIYILIFPKEKPPRVYYEIKDSHINERLVVELRD